MEIPGYSIVRELGRGGMATVYLAIQESLERQVALKVMSHGLAGNQSFKDRFLKEGRIVAHLNHRNIVTIYDVGFVDDLHFIAMEYVVGRSLSERIPEGLTLRQSINVVKRIARALNHAHERGFIHRDIKPSNILFRDDRDAVLADFGIAKSLQDVSGLTVTGLTPGTPNYMSPDQLRGRALDGRSDLYSLGVVFYEMLTGERPFEAETGIAIALRHINDPPPELPDEFSALRPVINCLLAKEPSGRFSNAAELIKALDRATTADRPTVAAREVEKTVPGPETARFEPDATRAEDSQTRVAARETEKTTLEPETTRFEPARSEDDRTRVAARETEKTIFQPETTRFEPDATRFDRTSFMAAEPATRSEQGPSIAAVERPVRPSSSKKSPKKPWLRRLAVGGVAVAAGIAIITFLASRKFEDHRQDQLTVERLLATADQQFAVAHLFEPRGDNAYQTYQRILAVEPDHPDALEGMTRIADTLEQEARAARSFGNRNESLALIKQGLSADPGNEGLLDLRKSIEGKIEERRERQRIGRLLADAEQDIEQGRLTQPSGNNAFEAFAAVLRTAPRNADALAGIERIATRIQELARALLNEGDFQAGLTLIDRALTIKPGQAGLRDLREQIHDQLRQAQERQRIVEARDRANAQLEAGRLIEPRGDNALETYQSILSKDRNNSQARTGIAEIAKQLEERARAKLQSGKYEQALVQVDGAIRALPDRAEFVALRTEITSAQLAHQQQMRISALLEKGQQQIADGKYLAPEDDNFLQTYESIRALDPGNARAEQGLRQAAAHFLAQAQEAKSAGEADQALDAISDGLRFVANDPALLALQGDIRQQKGQALARERRLAELLARAKARMSAGHLMVPGDDSAYAAYQEVLKRDPQNKAAFRGIADIAARMLQKAQHMFADGALEESLAVARLGLQAAPRQANLTALERRIQARLNQKLQAEGENQRIAELLALAQQQLAAVKLTLPVGDNAFESYQEVLSLDADNQQAKNGLRDVVSRYTEMIKTMLPTGDLQEALAMAERGLTIEPGYQELRSLRDEIAREIGKQEAREGEISRLLAEAQQGLEAGRLTEPQGDNALEAFQYVLAIDPGNQRAQDGVRAIADRYGQMATAARDDGKYEKGLRLAALGLDVEPNDSYLNSLQTEIQATLQAQAGREQTLEKLYAQAQQQIEEQKLTLPPGDNAYETIQGMRGIDPNDARAARALDELLYRYESLALARQRDGALQESLALVDKGLKIAPERARLVALRESLNREIEIARQAEVDAQAPPVAESAPQPEPEPPVVREEPEVEEDRPRPFGTF